MVVWKILGVDKVAELNTQQNVVTAVHYSVEATDGSTTAKYNDCIDITFNTLASYQFIPFENLTEEDLVSFVKNEFGYAADTLEKAIVGKLTLFKNTNKTYVDVGT